MSLQVGMFILGYVVVFGAFVVWMQYHFANERIKRLQKEVEELQKARWDQEHKLTDKLLEARRELWGKHGELRTELQKQIIEERAAMEKLAEKLRSEFRPETTKNLAQELLKRMQEDWMKQLDRRLSKVEEQSFKEQMRQFEESEKKYQAIFERNMQKIKNNLKTARGGELPDDEVSPPDEEVKN